MMLALLGGEVERNPGLYYSVVNPSTRPNATWAKKKMNSTITGASPLAASTGQLVPYITPDTSITLTNASPWPATYTVSVSTPSDGNPRNGPQTSVSLPPGQSKTLENLVSQEGSAYIRTTGGKPAVAAERPGLFIPVVDEEYANNRSKQGGILQTGEEKVVTMSGDSTSTNTVSFEARGPEGAGYVSSGPMYLSPNTVGVGYVNAFVHSVMPPNSACDSTPKFEDESKMGVLYLYENPTTLDQRMQPGQNYTMIAPQEYDIENVDSGC